MNISFSEKFISRVKVIKKKEKWLTYLYMVVSATCLYKAVQHADLTGKASSYLDIAEQEWKDNEEKD